MRRRIGILLAAVLLLLCLSGVSAGAADSPQYFKIQSGGSIVNVANKDLANVTLSWSISNTTINVESTMEWNPDKLRYDVKTISVDKLCSPSIAITVENYNKGNL